jgi:hypothetical protein
MGTYAQQEQTEGTEVVLRYLCFLLFNSPVDNRKAALLRIEPPKSQATKARRQRMGSDAPNPKKRSYRVRINGQIRASKVRVVGEQGEQFGILALADALSLARARGVDLVEIAPNLKPPVCRIVDIARFRANASKQKET